MQIDVTTCNEAGCDAMHDHIKISVKLGRLPFSPCISTSSSFLILSLPLLLILGLCCALQLLTDIPAKDK
jgi:hypothetical protein